MFHYYLVHGSKRIRLFESQFRFLTEETCLSHYEKGLAKGLFRFDRSRIDQVWTMLGLWGLIGRVCPVELVRVLCAFGCAILRTVDSRSDGILPKSFEAVTFVIPVRSDQHVAVRCDYQFALESGAPEPLQVLLELDDRLVVGSYYTTATLSVDEQFPKFCDILERDCCFPKDCLKTSVFRLFCKGFRLIAKTDLAEIELASWNSNEEVIRGFKDDLSLFYLGVFKRCA